MNLLQNTLVKPVPSSVQNVNDMFPGFAVYDLALLHGISAIASPSSLLAVRSQLPFKLRGLRTRVVFIDGRKIFRLHKISRISEISS